MKRKISCVLILSLIAFYSFAQSDTKKNGNVKNKFEQTKYGFIGGFSFNKLLTSSTSFENMDFKRKPAPVGGIFVEYPIPESILAFRCEATYMESSYSYHRNKVYNNFFVYTSYTSEKDLLMDLKTINLPIILRISDYERKAGMFVDMGLNFTFNIKNQWHIYETNHQSDGIYIDELIDENLNADVLVGYSFGLGFYRYFGKQRAYLEARTGRSTPVYDGDFNMSQNQMVAGFSF